MFTVRRRGFALSVDGKSFDGSVNRGGKRIQIIIYVCMLTFLTVCSVLLFEEGAIFVK